MSATLSTINSVLKVLYPDNKGLPREALYKMSPTWALLSKTSDFKGASISIPIQTTGRSTPSPTASIGFGTSTANTYRNFLITTARNYFSGTISTEAMLAADGENEGSFIDALDREIKGSMYGVGRSISANLFGNTGMALGQISAGSNTGTATITLADARSVVNFEVGMTLETSATDGTSGSVRSGTVTITSISSGDVVAGTGATLTASGNWTAGITGCAASDFIFASGSFGLGFAGLAAWNPVTAPTSGDSFFGVDRSSNATRLAGSRTVATGMNIEEAIMYGATTLRVEGGTADYVVMHPVRFQQLMNSVYSKAWTPVMGTEPRPDRSKPGAKVSIGYDGLKITAAGMSLIAIDDPQCPFGVLRLFNSSDLEFRSRDAVPHLQDFDGLKIIRTAGADSYGFRGGYYGNLVCYNPQNLCVVTLLWQAIYFIRFNPWARTTGCWLVRFGPTGHQL